VRTLVVVFLGSFFLGAIGSPPEGFVRLVANFSESTLTAPQRWCSDMVPRTNLWAPECRRNSEGAPHNDVETRPFLVTGVGRSGTQYLQEVMSGAGLDVAHDNKHQCNSQCPGRDGAVAWPHAFADNSFTAKHLSSYRRCAVPHWSWPSLVIKFRVVVHLVRSPLKTIDSRWSQGKVKPFLDSTLCNTAAEWNQVFGRAQALAQTIVGGLLPHTTMGGSLAFTLRHWVLWNFAVEAHASRRYRIEDLSDSPSALLSLCRDIQKLDALALATDDHYRNHNDDGELHHHKLQEHEGGRQLNSLSCPSLEEFAGATSRESKRTNHEHTKHAQGGVQWSELAQLDQTMTTLAQRMSVRYGYPVKAADLVPRARIDGGNESEPVNGSEMERCKFRSRDGRWKCDLIRKR